MLIKTLNNCYFRCKTGNNFEPEIKVGFNYDKTPGRVQRKSNKLFHHEIQNIKKLGLDDFSLKEHERFVIRINVIYINQSKVSMQVMRLFQRAGQADEETAES